MFRLNSDESIVVDSGTNPTLIVHARYIVRGNQEVPVSFSLNAEKKTIIKGPGQLVFLSIFNKDSSAHEVSIAIDNAGIEAPFYNHNLQPGDLAIANKDSVQSVISGFAQGGGSEAVATQDVNIISSIPLPIDDSTPIDVNLTNSLSVNNPTSIAGRLRVSKPKVQFSSDFEYSKLDTFWGESGIAGGGIAAHLPDEGAVELSTGDGDNASRCRRRTHTWFRYQPGSPSILFGSFQFATGKTNLKQQVGLYDDENGIFLQRDNVTTYIVLRSNVTGSVLETRIAQGSWNGDTLDGGGASGITIDWTKSQLICIEYLWLGVGPIVVVFEINGQFYKAHEFSNTNVNTSTYMTTGNLPITYEIFNDGLVTGSSEMRQICCSIFSEGGKEINELNGDLRSADSGDSVMATPATETAVLAIRLKTTFNGKANRGQVWPYNLSFHVGDAEECRFIVYFGAGVTAGAWVDNGSDSLIEYNFTMTGFTAGTVLIRKFVLENSSIVGELAEKFLKVPLTLQEDGTTQPILLITSKNLTGGSANSRATIDWKENK